MTDNIDVTKLVNKGISRTWKCPHCGHVQKFGQDAENILFEHFRYLEGCDRCMYVHCWTLELTDDFKRKIVEEAKAIAEKVGLKKEDLW